MNINVGKRLINELNIAVYKGVVQTDPWDSNSYLWLADEYAENGEWEKAVKVLEKGYKQLGGSQDLQQRKKAYAAKIDTQAAIQQELPEHIRKGIVHYTDDCYDVYSYDEQGRLVKKECYDAAGNLEDYYTYSYNSHDGQQCSQLKMESYDSDGSLGYYDIYYYDRCDGQYRLVKKEEYGLDESNEDLNHTYSYDKQGNLVKEEWHGCYYCTYSYNKQGELVKEERHDSGGSLQYYHMYNYDKCGNLMKEERYDSGGSLEYYCIYHYDEQHNLIRNAEHGSDG